MTKTVIMMDHEYVLRRKEADKVTVLWMGAPTNPLREAIDRCNAGEASEDDYAALEAVPVYDEDIDLDDCLQVKRLYGHA